VQRAINELKTRAGGRDFGEEYPSKSSRAGERDSVSDTKNPGRPTKGESQKKMKPNRGLGGGTRKGRSKAGVAGSGFWGGVKGKGPAVDDGQNLKKRRTFAEKATNKAGEKKDSYGSRRIEARTGGSTREKVSGE